MTLIIIIILKVKLAIISKNALLDRNHPLPNKPFRQYPKASGRSPQILGCIIFISFHVGVLNKFLSYLGI